MKKLIIGFTLGVSLAIGGSAFAMPAVITPVLHLTPAEQIAKGNVFDMYTGKKLTSANAVPEAIKGGEVSSTELRFRSLEARVSLLEAKQK